MLQNLLSDDEDDCSGAEDNTHDRATSSFDSERRYEPEVVDETPQVSPRKKRVSACCSSGPCVHSSLLALW